MKIKSAKGMLSFEVHAKLLAGLALYIVLTISQTVPLVILVMQSVTRVRFHFTGYLPDWVKALNRDVLEGYERKQQDEMMDMKHSDVDVSYSYELLWTTAAYVYLLSEILVALFLWKSAKEKSVPKLKVWICLCITLTGVGILLLGQFREFEIVEVGLVVVYTKVSLIYSIYTFVVVLFLIMKIKLGLPS